MPWMVRFGQQLTCSHLDRETHGRVDEIVYMNYVLNSDTPSRTTTTK